VLLRRENKSDLPFHKVYSYGKSTKNQRIEAWRNLLTEGQTQEWKVFFAELEGEELFDGGDIDKSCLQYIYIDIIRSHIHQFVGIHNSHRIRRQRPRSHYLTTGQPYLLYHYPESTRDYKAPVNLNLLSKLEAEVENFDLDQYLPGETMELYARLLSVGGFPAEYVYSDTRHRSAYIFLWEEAARYLSNGGEISLFNTPTGAEEWIQVQTYNEISHHREFDNILVLDETDDDQSDDIESGQISSDDIRAETIGIDSGGSAIYNEIDDSHPEDRQQNNIVWDLSEGEDSCEGSNDGYFLDL